MNVRSLPQLPRSVRRISEIVGILAKYGLADWLSGSGLERYKNIFVGEKEALLATAGHLTRVRLAVIELGPTYIKLGQMLSTRPDLVGPDVAEELAKLQDGVPADPPKVVLATVAAELGRPIEAVFREFSPTPIGSASIGQVHRARLLEGQEVVVKVQHPGIETRIRDDLVILQTLAGLAEASEHLKRYQPVAIVREFSRSLTRELDFTQEERNLQHFAANFSADATVHFPKVFSAVGTSRLLTMELLQGVSLHDNAGLDNIGISREGLARRGAMIWMEMVFRDGFFHADPHPGNLLVLPGGVIGILDAGMVASIDETLRETIEDGMVAISRRDSAHLTRLITRLCSAPADFDKDETFAAEVTDYVAFYGSQPIEHLRLADALNEFVRILARYRLILPSGASTLIKTFAMLEGTALLLSPAINVLDLIQSYQREMFLRRLSPLARFETLQRALSAWLHLGQTFPWAMNDLLENIQRGKFEIQLVHRRLEPLVNRLVMGLVTSALFLGSALLWSNRVPPVIDGYSALGVSGCLASFVLGARLLHKIWQE